MGKKAAVVDKRQLEREIFLIGIEGMKSIPSFFAPFLSIKEDLYCLTI